MAAAERTGSRRPSVSVGACGAAVRGEPHRPAGPGRGPLPFGFCAPFSAESLLDRLINASHQVIMNGPGASG
jgi:hypothetical protein